jgi:Domain of unknown function DUF29
VTSDPVTLAPQRASDSAYDADFCAWAVAQAKLLRAGRLAEADIAHIAEEIEDLAKRDRRELASRVRTVMEHQLKLTASPATGPRPGWEAIIDRERVEIGRLLEDSPSLRGTERVEIGRLLEDSPSLRGTLPDVIARELKTARRLVARDMSLRGETPTVALGGLTYDVDQVLGPAS